MFYPAEALKRGGRFYLCWVADAWPLRFATITHRQLWSQDIRQICDDLSEVLRNESGRPKNRFSLRLSSQLLRGLVRLYHRKVIVFVGDLCMINAIVMKSTNKKFNRLQVTSDHLELPRLVFVEPDDNEVEEEIQNNKNIVANVQDITMQEPTLIQNRVLLDDGFGELHPDQSLQLFERTVEMMMLPETSVHVHSGLDLPLDVTDKSQDRSRLITNEAHMEMIAEHDTTVFVKSVEDLTEPMNIDILEIPEIPPTTVPEPTNHNMEKILALEDILHVSKDNEELSLEELEPIAKKRKLKNIIIIDKKTRLSSNYICSRIEQIRVELRCEDSWRDVARPLQPAHALLSAPAAARAVRLRALYAPTARARRPQRPAPEHTPILEVPLATMSRTSHTRSVLERIDEEIEPVDQSVNIAMNIETERSEVLRQSNIAKEIHLDISEMPTQTILTESQERKRISELDKSAKRQRTSGVMSYHVNRTEEINLEVNKENIPSKADQDLQQLTAILQAAGLEDGRPLPDEQPNQGRKDSSSETPLGSLDRTKVSLGESERTTDSKRFIREEWGTAATMHKIYKCSRSRPARRVTVDVLLQGGPLLAGHKRIIAARLFTSILKLKQHGFIVIHKDSVTQEIVHIDLGEKITCRYK